MQKSGLCALDEVLKEGKDLQNLLWEIIKYVKDILVYKTSKDLKLYNETELKQIEELSNNISKEKLIGIIYTLSEIENNIKWSSQKEIMLQTGIIKLCTTTENDGIEELKQKIQNIEEKINSGNIKINSTKQIVENRNSEVVVETNKATTKPQKVNKVDLQNLSSEEYWTKVLDKLKQTGKMVLYSNLVSTKAKQKDDLTLEIVFPNGLTPFGKSLLEKPENKNEIEKLVSIECGKQMMIKFVDAKEYVPKKENSIEDMVKSLDIPVNIIEE